MAAVTTLGARSSIGKIVVIVLLGLFAGLWLWFILTGGLGPPGHDIERVRLGAMRLRAGEPLYTNVGDPNLWYTWAPWLAWLWLPLTFLPTPAVDFVWMAICFASWGAAVWPARGSLPTLLLLGSLTFYGAWVGNVQAPMIALLVWTIGGRLGPVALGTAASLKISPLLFAFVWARQGNWRKVAVAIATALVLTAPAFFSGIDRYPFALDPQISLRKASDLLWIVATLAAILWVFAARSPSFRWVAAAVSVIASRPSLLVYDVGYLLVPLAISHPRRPEKVGRSRDEP